MKSPYVSGKLPVFGTTNITLDPGNPEDGYTPLGDGVTDGVGVGDATGL